MNTAWDRQNTDFIKGKPHGWIQWKGTEVCMDVHCECGHMGHVDGDFAYYVECPSCHRVYMTNGHIELVELTADEIGATRRRSKTSAMTRGGSMSNFGALAERFNTVGAQYHDAYCKWQVVADPQRRVFGDCRLRAWGDTLDEAVAALLREVDRPAVVPRFKPPRRESAVTDPQVCSRCGAIAISFGGKLGFYFLCGASSVHPERCGEHELSPLVRAANRLFAAHRARGLWPAAHPDSPTVGGASE